MYENHDNKRRPSAGRQFVHQKMFFVPDKSLTSAEILNLVQNSQLRFADNPVNLELAYLTSLMSEDDYLQDLFRHAVDEQIGQAMLAGDEFRDAYPPAGSVSVTVDMICAGLMPTGDPIVFDGTRLFCNFGLFGRTGSGKTSWLYLIVKQLLTRDF